MHDSGRAHSCSNVIGKCTPLLSAAKCLHPWFYLVTHTHTTLTSHYLQPRGRELVNVQMELEIGSTLKPIQSRFSCQFFRAGGFRSRYWDCVYAWGGVALEGESLRQSRPGDSLPGDPGEGEHLQGHVSFAQSQLAAAFQIFVVGRRESSPKLSSNRKGVGNKGNVSDSIP